MSPAYLAAMIAKKLAIAGCHHSQPFFASSTTVRGFLPPPARELELTKQKVKTQSPIFKKSEEFLVRGLVCGQISPETLAVVYFSIDAEPGACTLYDA